MPLTTRGKPSTQVFCGLSAGATSGARIEFQVNGVKKRDLEYSDAEDLASVITLTGSMVLAVEKGDILRIRVFPVATDESVPVTLPSGRSWFHMKRLRQYG
jgi:hypothetical protein